MKKIYCILLLIFIMPITAMHQGKMIEFTTSTFESNGKPFTILKPSTNGIVHPEFSPFIVEMQNRQPINIIGYENAVRMKNYEKYGYIPEIRLQQQLAIIREYNKQFGR